MPFCVESFKGDGGLDETDRRTCPSLDMELTRNAVASDDKFL